MVKNPPSLLEGELFYQRRMKGVNIMTYKCDICSHDENLEVFNISNRGYQSNFDGDHFEIVLCEGCKEKHQVSSDWFDADKNFTLEGEDEESWLSSYYKHEDDIIELIRVLTPEAQQRVKDCYNEYDPNYVIED